MSQLAFDDISLYPTNQQIILGSLLFPPLTAVSNNVAEYGIQLTGREPYPRELVCRLFELISSTVMCPPGTVAYYFPAFEQTEAAALDEAYFAERGIKVSTPNRWIQEDQVYSTGWALGRIKFVAATDIDSAYANGTLLPTDVLLTDGVPAEIPFVSGIISLSLATPNSHVAISANGYGIPFVYMANPADQSRLQQLAGREVVLQASIRWGLSVIDVIDVEGTLEPALRAELLALKEPVPVNLMPKAQYGAFSVLTDNLTLDDIKYVGGKAANMGLLRRVLPTNSPVAIAFTFDLWDAFMDQVLPIGRTLGTEISNRLSGFSYPPNVTALQSNLAAIRDLITRTAQFTAGQRQVITNALSGFDPLRKIRFRSSSNAEDNKTFSAAGLYDSYSGCLADDQDGDSVGPCRCDATENNERGVFRAIQKVYASFYNDNAFLERLRHGIDESQVGMALLVHYSTPDEVELANGVATVSYEGTTGGSRQLQAQLVTQAGAVSITNPDTNGRPEIVVVGERLRPVQNQSSSLIPLGSRVLNWPADYQNLARMLFQVYSNYCGWRSGTTPTNFPLLDFEYKKDATGALLVKQVRELPVPGPTLDTPYLLNEPTTYWVYQYEASRALANHRVKCRLTLRTKNLRLTATNLTECFYTDARFEYRDGTNLFSLTGTPTNWPGAFHSVSNVPSVGMVVQDSWTVGSGTNQRLYCLRLAIPLVNAAETPFVAQRELRKWLSVTYATPVPTLDRQLNATLTNREEIQLIYCPNLSNTQPALAETLATTNGVSFQISVFDILGELRRRSGIDPTPMIGPVPLAPLAETRIEGLTFEPIVLRDYYSQSAAPGHWSAEYVFEPRLEPDLPAAQLGELEAANIQLIHVFNHITHGSRVTILGCDGHFRAL